MTSSREAWERVLAAVEADARRAEAVLHAPPESFLAEQQEAPAAENAPCSGLPADWLLLLVPVGLLGLTSSPRRALWITPPLFVLLYVPHTFFLEHYGVVVAPAAAFAVALGAKVIEDAWPRRREATTVTST